MFVKFSLAYCLQTASNMAMEIYIQMALIPLQCIMLHLESKSRQQCREALLHPQEDVQERLISALKALQVSKKPFFHISIGWELRIPQ